MIFFDWIPRCAFTPVALVASLPAERGIDHSRSTSCAGLSICTPPPPDAEGNPACYYRDGWAAAPSGSGINVYYFRESSTETGAEQLTADVRLKDGTTASQIAAIDAGQSNHQIQFPGIDKATVQEVLLTSSAGRCFVIGPDGS